VACRWSGVSANHSQHRQIWVRLGIIWAKFIQLVLDCLIVRFGGRIRGLHLTKFARPTSDDAMNTWFSYIYGRLPKENDFTCPTFSQFFGNSFRCSFFNVNVYFYVFEHEISHIPGLAYFNTSCTLSMSWIHTGDVDNIQQCSPISRSDSWILVVITFTNPIFIGRLGRCRGKIEQHLAITDIGRQSGKVSMSLSENHSHARLCRPIPDFN